MQDLDGKPFKMIVMVEFKPKSKESDIYIQLSKWLSLQYPAIIYRFDAAAGMKMTKGQAVKNKKMNPINGYPDFFLVHPRKGKIGLFLEIKRVEDSPYRQNGTLRATDHILDQSAMLKRLESLGFVAQFAVGIEGCINAIEDYLK